MVIMMMVVVMMIMSVNASRSLILLGVHCTFVPYSLNS